MCKLCHFIFIFLMLMHEKGVLTFFLSLCAVYIVLNAFYKQLMIVIHMNPEVKFSESGK